MENKPISSITAKDVETANKFGKFILDKAKWDLTTKENMELFQYLMWFNQLPQKLTENIKEIKAYTPPPEEQPEKEKPTKSKKSAGE